MHRGTSWQNGPYFPYLSNCFYELGKERSGAKTDGSFLVVEDSPAGVKAGKAAGCAVLGLATTHSIERVKSAGADWLVKDLQSVKFLSFSQDTGQISIEISDTLEEQ